MTMDAGKTIGRRRRQRQQQEIASEIHAIHCESRSPSPLLPLPLHDSWLLLLNPPLPSCVCVEIVSFLFSPLLLSFPPPPLHCSPTVTTKDEQEHCLCAQAVYRTLATRDHVPALLVLSFHSVPDSGTHTHTHTHSNTSAKHLPLLSF